MRALCEEPPPVAARSGDQGASSMFGLAARKVARRSGLRTIGYAGEFLNARDLRPIPGRYLPSCSVLVSRLASPAEKRRRCRPYHRRIGNRPGLIGSLQPARHVTEATAFAAMTAQAAGTSRQRSHSALPANTQSFHESSTAGAGGTAIGMEDWPRW